MHACRICMYLCIMLKPLFCLYISRQSNSLQIFSELCLSLNQEILFDLIFHHLQNRRLSEQKDIQRGRARINQINKTYRQCQTIEKLC